MSNKIRIWQNYWAIFYTFFTFDCETALWNMSVCMMSVWSFWLIFKMSKSNRRAHILFNIPMYFFADLFNFLFVIFLQTCSFIFLLQTCSLFFFAMFLSDKIVQQNFFYWNYISSPKKWHFLFKKNYVAHFGCSKVRSNHFERW